MAICNQEVATSLLGGEYFKSHVYLNSILVSHPIYLSTTFRIVEVRMNHST